MADEEQQLNEHGIPEQDMADARKEARALARGEEPQEEEKEVEQEPVETKPAQEKVEVRETKVVDDPLASLPEEHREKIAAILKADRDKATAAENRYKSDIGRITSYQAKYEEARREAADLKSKLAAQSKTPPKSLKDLSPRFAELAEVDEGLVDTLDEARKIGREEALAEMEAKLEARLAPLYEDRQQNAQSAQQRSVDEFNRTMTEKVANWQDILFAKDESGNLKLGENNVPVFSDGWAEFLNDQPPAFKAAYQNPASAEDGLRALKDYEVWGTEKGYFEAPPEKKLPNADAIQQKRQNDLKKAAPPKTTPVPLSQTQEVDFSDEAAVTRYRQQVRKALRDGDTSILKQR